MPAIIRIQHVIVRWHTAGAMGFIFCYFTVYLYITFMSANVRHIPLGVRKPYVTYTLTPGSQPSLQYTAPSQRRQTSSERISNVQ